LYVTRTRGFALRIPNAEVAAPLALLLFSLLGFKVLRKLVFHFAQSETNAFLLVLACCAGAACFTGIRYAALPQLLRAVVRGIGVVVLVQVLFDTLAPVPPAPNVLFGEGGGHALFFRYGGMVAIAAGVASLWRPSFLVPLFAWYVSFRLLIGPLSGIPVVDTDYLNMLDTGLFAVVGALFVLTVTSEEVLQRAPWLRGWMGGLTPAELRLGACSLLWACAVGAHLGNYFCSGLAKLLASGVDAPWTWLLRNPTQTAMVIGLERGDNPLATFPHLLQWVWDCISGNALYFNFFVLGAQLLAPFAILRLRWLLVFTLLFDVFHIGVYFTLGALFHFWIAVNLIVYSSAWRLKESDITPMMKAVCVVTVMFGNLVFYTNWLGWLDGAKLASPQFYAETRDGRSVLMPQVYYGIYSYTIAQAGMYIPDNHFSFRIGGNNLNRAAWQDATHCGPAIMPHQDTGVSEQAVETLVRDTDRFMRANPAIKDLNLYYLYPHHMQPNPWVFTEFNRLKLEDIIGYRYVVESVCLDLKGGQLQRDVRHRSEFRYDVR
jgi:hypothetical protein